MPRYIDADELLAWYDDIRKYEKEILSENYHKERKDEARIKISILDKMYFKVQELEDKTADVQEVRHGEWIQDTWLLEEINKTEPIAVCSVCGYAVPLYDMDYDDIVRSYQYCPYCGAKMDRKENGDGRTDTD